MEEKISRILSYLFHPLMLPTYVVLIFLFQDTFYSFLIPVQTRIKVITLIFSATFVLPVLANVFFLNRGIIKSMEMESREERVFPFLIASIMFYLTAQILKAFQLPSIFYLFMLGSTLLVIIALFINFFMKISIHMLGIGAVLGTFVGLSLKWMIDFKFLILILVLVAGLTGFSRLRLQAHRHVEIYSGFLTGAILMCLLFILI